jgi:hypothetical protein
MNENNRIRKRKRFIPEDELEQMKVIKKKREKKE